ncbi:MAG TPA: serine/threonine-protein kinase, partial [Gemmataceae bacterium]
MAASDSELSPDDRAMLSMRVDEFHVALARGSTDWTPFLEGLAGGVRRAVLAHLAAIELGHRWENGEQPTPADYVARFPELGPEGGEPAALTEEYERRREGAGNAAFATQRSNRLPAEEPIAAPTRTVMASGVPKLAAAFNAGPGDAVVAIDQQYQMVRELGRGAFGEVWLARKMPSGIEKAVKILHQPADQDVAQRELRSLELIKNLRHPYLLATEDFWVANNRLYIVTELADISLRRRLVDCKEEGHPGIPVDELFVYIHESADGFDFLHSKQIAHRDVKPDNILIVNGHAKVADFGLARTSETNVAQMSFAGTPAYMAPEVWGGEGGPASDLYGFAMSYIELRQGSTPFKFGKVMEVMQAHLNGNFEFAAFIGEAERTVLRRALAKEPADRYPSCLAFVEDLAEALGRQIHRKSGAVPPPRSRLTLDSAAGADTNPAVATVRTDTGSLPVPAPAPPRRSSKKLVAGITAGLLVAVSIGTFAVKGCGNRDGSLLPDGGAPAANGNDGILPKGATAEEGAKIIALADGRSLPQWVTAARNGETIR